MYFQPLFEQLLKVRISPVHDLQQRARSVDARPAKTTAPEDTGVSCPLAWTLPSASCRRHRPNEPSTRAPTAAPVVLSASLPEHVLRSRCFSERRRCACGARRCIPGGDYDPAWNRVYDLRGYGAHVHCAATCATRKRIFSGGLDGPWGLVEGARIALSCMGDISDRWLSQRTGAA